MKRIFITIIISLLSGICYAQSGDFCYNSRDTSILISAVCFDKTMGADLTIALVKTINPNSQGVRILKNNALYSVPNSYVFTQYDGDLKGITRASFDIAKNARIMLACLPYDKKLDINYVQIVVVFVTDGESQLLTNEVCKKEKSNSGQNISIYKIAPHIQTVNYQGKELDLPIEVLFEDGQKLYGLNIGGTMNFKFN